MFEKQLKRSGAVVLGALAMAFTFGTNAKACSLPGGPGLTYTPDTLAMLKLAGPKPEATADADRTADRYGNGPASVTGLWQVTYSSGGQVVDMAFEVFHSDGTEMLNDITAPSEGNVCLGVWTQTGRTTYRLTHPSWTFAANGSLTGTALFDVTVTLTTADKFTGTYTLSYFDTTGNAGPVYSGTLAATRILPNY